MPHPLCQLRLPGSPSVRVSFPVPSFLPFPPPSRQMSRSPRLHSPIIVFPRRSSARSAPEVITVLIVTCRRVSSQLFHFFYLFFHRSACPYTSCRFSDDSCEIVPHLLSYAFHHAPRICFQQKHISIHACMHTDLLFCSNAAAAFVSSQFS
jgi:hypothetical protein